MNYVITADIFDQVNTATSDPGKEGSAPVAPKLVKTPVNKVAYNLNAGKDATFTGAEIKAKIKEHLRLADTVIDITLKTGDGKDVADDAACDAYGVKFQATNPYVAPVKPTN